MQNQFRLVLREDISEKVALGLTAERQKSTSHDKIWGQRAPGRGKSNHTASKAGKYMPGMSENQQEGWNEVMSNERLSLYIFSYGEVIRVF